MENQDNRNKSFALNASGGRSKTKRSSNQVSEGRISARWNIALDRKFIELCEEEIGKGNRPNSHFNVNGWRNLVKRFNEATGRNYVYKQLRNHWDSMKKEWMLFKKLMHKETGIGWNPLKNSINASDEWWDRKISENGDYSKFKNKDLSLIWFRYDALFSDVAATRERARAPSQIFENEIEIENEMFKPNEPIGVEEYVGTGEDDCIDDIGVDEYNTSFETNEINNLANDLMFPSLASTKRKYYGENNRGKRISGATSLKEDIQSLLKFMENKNVVTSSSSTDITIGAALEILNNIPGIAPSSEVWNYACNLLSKKDMREVFVGQPSQESRLSWLEFNYDLFKKSK